MSGRLTEEHRRRLLDVLREAAGSEVHFVDAPRRFPSAAFSGVYEFRLARAPDRWSGPLVLRSFPPSAPDDQLVLESAIQNAVAEQGFPAPRVLLVHEAPDVLGAPFVVMERLPGRPVLGGSRPDLFARDFPRVFRAWPRQFAETLRRLQRIDAQHVLRAMTASGVDAARARTTRHVTFVHDRLATYADDGLGEVLRWLDDHRPAAPDPPVVVHGDLWPANVLWARGELRGLVDWNRAGVGHPALDVGFAAEGLALMPAPFPPPPPVAQFIRAAGLSLSTRLSRGTEADDEAVRYYRVLRCLLELADVAAAAAAPSATSLPAWARATTELVSRLRRLTGVPARLPSVLGTARPGSGLTR